MTCRKARKLLPLAAGGDLTEAKSRKVALHLKSCPACRAELEAYRSALKRIRGFDSENTAGPSWDEAAWAKAVRKAVKQEGAPAALRPKLAMRPAVVAVVGMALIVAAALLVVNIRHVLRPRDVLEARTEEAQHDIPATVEPKPEPSPVPEHQTTVHPPKKIEAERPLLAAGKTKPARAPVERALTGASPAAAPLAQDVISATFVSQETGLKIVWFFDRNFDWKGEEK
jgi:hypothetical protein